MYIVGAIYRDPPLSITSPIEIVIRRKKKKKEKPSTKKNKEKKEESQKTQKIRPLPLSRVVAKIIKKRQGIYVESSSTTILLLHPDDSLGDIAQTAQDKKKPNSKSLLAIFRHLLCFSNGENKQTEKPIKKMNLPRGEVTTWSGVLENNQNKKQKQNPLNNNNSHCA